MVSTREAVVVAGIVAGLSFGFSGMAEVSAKSGKSAKGGKSAKSVKAATSCVYQLEASATETGTAVVNIRRRSVRIRVRGAIPNSMYTVWTDHFNRAADELASDFPTFPVIPSSSYHGNPHPRGVAPTFASTAGVTSGMGLDLNAFRTNANGDANFRVRLDFNLLEPGASPIIAAELATQGANIVGGSWLRMYTAPVVAPSVQAVDGNGLPVLVRSTAQGFTVQHHPDFTSHGHFPGTGISDGGADHSNAWKGDFPEECMNP